MASASGMRHTSAMAYAAGTGQDMPAVSSAARGWCVIMQGARAADRCCGAATAGARRVSGLGQHAERPQFQDHWAHSVRAYVILMPLYMDDLFYA